MAKRTACPFVVEVWDGEYWEPWKDDCNWASAANAESAVKKDATADGIYRIIQVKKKFNVVIHNYSKTSLTEVHND